MGSKKHRNKPFVMPKGFTYQEFVVEYLGPRMDSLFGLKAEVETGLHQQTQQPIPDEYLKNYKDGLDALCKRLTVIRCETPQQQRHVAELLQKLGRATEAGMYLYKNYKPS